MNSTQDFVNVAFNGVKLLGVAAISLFWLRLEGFFGFSPKRRRIILTDLKKVVCLVNDAWIGLLFITRLTLSDWTDFGL